MANTGKYNFIKLSKIVIRNFSLYKKNGKIIEVEEHINDGVYCLAGANGLGKTTFLNTINYGLTGIVLEPNKEVLSPQEIVVSNKRYTSRYFTGRIKEKDKISAEIEISFIVDNLNFRIIRGFENIDELRQLEIFRIDGEKKIALIQTDDLSPQELNSLYQTRLTEAIGIKNFDYFIFYQLYVLTFDENRRMIFWDDRASSHALSIAFNTDLEDTERIIKLKRKMEKLESDGRNIRWQATQMSNKIKTLQKARKDESGEDSKVKIDYDKDFKKLEKLEKEFNNVRTEYDTILKKQSFLNSDIMHLRLGHTRLFSQYSEPRSKLLENAYVQVSLKKQECCLCGAHGNQIVESIKKNIYEEKCPLCDTKIDEERNDEQEGLLKQIQKNDKAITKKNAELENLILEVKGKKVELEKVEYEYNKLGEKIENYLKSYPALNLKKDSNENVNVLLQQYKEQYERLDKESRTCYRKRDGIRPEYDKLLDKTDKAYKEAEIVFVPTFKNLAKSFIGLDLNIKSERDKKNIFLVLELENTARTDSFQLSESQRFFLDIALRMSLSIYLSKKGNEATMLIDTPEGSLDIAYENRVGIMFAEYVKNYNQNIIMTANINASQLLISLAEKCGSNKMTFRRMLEWTDLTTIQKQGEHLFEKVYKNIELALKGNNK